MATRFFEDEFPYNLIVKKVPTRVASMVICLALLIAAASSASKIQPQTSTENFLPDNHPFQRNIAINNEFEASNFDNTVEINMVWGFKENDPINQQGVNLIFDADYKGKPNYKPDFALPAAAQTALVSVCELLKTDAATKVEIDTTTGNSSVLTECFIETFRDYRGFKGLSFPVEGADEAAKALEQWLEDKDKAVPTKMRAQKHETDVGWTKANGKLTLSWVKLRASSLLGARAFLPAAKLREYYNTWETVLADANKITVPTPLGNGFQMSGANAGRSNKWIFMTVQEAYIRMALVGAGVGLGIATIVLLFATRNLIVTTCCMATIAAALGCVIGTIVAMGWQLGSNESLCIMVLTGFAVDYVVHLSHSYMESSAMTRLDRVHDALRDMGISVFWGMLTSMFAAAALASCQIQFLSKFGIFFMLTISYAYLWSVLFLMPLLACVGPQPIGSAHGVGGAEMVSPTPPFKDPSFETAASAPPSPPASVAGDVAPPSPLKMESVKRTQTAPYVV